MKKNYYKKKDWLGLNQNEILKSSPKKLEDVQQEQEDTLRNRIPGLFDWLNNKLKGEIIMDCNHKWRRVYEESLIGGIFSVGWECIECKKFINNQDITPEGLSGIVLKNSARLHGPLGGYGIRSDGSRYKEQIINEEGKLTIIN